MTSKRKITLEEYIHNEVYCENQYLHLAPLVPIESTACESIRLLYDSEFDKYCVLNITSLQYAENLDHARMLYQEQISKFNNSLKSN